MARIELRNTKVFIEDGLAGTATVNNVAGAAIAATSVTVDDVSTNANITTMVPIGARFKVGDVEHTVTARTPADAGPTTQITFTPALETALEDDDEIEFLPQQLEIKIGDGDISWTEGRELLYDLDRGRLDTVRLGDEQPLAVEIQFTFEYITSQSGKPITPLEAIKGIKAASEWVSSSDDLCEPYACNIRVRNCVPCGTDHDEDIVFPDFRWESLDYSVADASVGVSGQCNATEALTSRGDLC